MVEQFTTKLGQKYVVDMEAGDKKVCVAGPCWIWASLEYQGERKGEEEVKIVAPSFAFKNENPYPCDEKTPDKKHVLPCTAGMHYCKLLSPARVMEWMYVTATACTTPWHRRVKGRVREEGRASLL